MTHKRYADKIVEWIREIVKDAGAEGVVVGMSGGIDSAVTSVLCKKAVQNTLGLILPIYSREEDKKDAISVAEQFKIDYKVIDLSSIFDELCSSIGERISESDLRGNMASSNLKPRLRMITLYYFANKNNYLVAGTSNKSELAIGYFTKYGDSGADFEPLGDFYKTEVYDLARNLGIPRKIIDKAPSAGLWSGQTDEEEVGISYEELDEILYGLEQSKDRRFTDTKKVEYVKELVKRSEHKRRALPTFKKL